MAGSKVNIHSCLVLIDSDMLGSDPVLEAVKDVLEDELVRRAVVTPETSRKVVEVVFISQIHPQGNIDKDEETDGFHHCVM